MCKVGDIIRIKSYRDHGNIIGKHSFVVIDDRKDQIEGIPYDMICNVLSSFKSESQKARKLSYMGNFPLNNSDSITDPDNGKDGYIKADQLYYFNKDTIDYQVIGYILPDILNLLIQFIEESDFEIIDIVDNL